MIVKSLKGLRVIITGSTRGIGRETARFLASQGAHVTLNGRNTELLEQLSEELSAYSVIAVEGDVTNPSDMEEVAAKTREKWGGIDVLINNAAVSMRGAFDSLHSTVAKAVVDINVLGSIYITRAVINDIITQKGSIIFISSISAICGFPGTSIYSASKMALSALSQSLDAEFHNRGLHSGIVYLPYVENDVGKTLLQADGKEINYSRSFTYTQERVAKIIGHMIQTRKRRKIVSMKGKWAWIASSVFPPLSDWILRRSGGKIHSIETHNDSKTK